MGVDTFSYGHELAGYFKPESSFGVAVKPTATDAFRATAITMGQPQGREFANDYRGTRSRIERIATRTPVQPWSASTLLRPSGAAGTAPDIGDLLKHVFGTETVSASTSVTYSPLKDMSALSGTLYRSIGNYIEHVYGAIVQNFTLRWTGDGFVTCEFTGIAKNYGHSGNTLADGAGSSASSLIVDDADFYDLYSVIKIGSEDNSGAGIQITAIDKATETLTLESSFSWSDNDAVAPFLPAGTFAGSPLVGTDGSISLDNGSSTIKHVGGSLSMSNGMDLLNTEFGGSDADDVTNTGMREVSMSLDFLMREDEAHLLSHYRAKTSKDIKVVIGSTAGSILTINANQAEIEANQLDSPESDMVRYSANVVCLGSASLEDEVELVFT